MMDFKNYSVVVTGGSRGIGRAIAAGFAQLGARVSVCGRDKTALAETENAIAAHSRAHVAVCDLTDPAAIKKYISDAAEDLGGIDVLVNNASSFSRSDDEDGWAGAFNTDMMAVVRASAAAEPWLAQSKRHPSIVHISSISAFHPTPRAAPYGAIKAAIVHYTQSQAARLGTQGIRVNSVAPGSITFPGHFWEERKARNDQHYLNMVAKIPAGRLGTPDEVADVVLFFASPLARWVTGQTIMVDGGQELSD